MPKKSTDAQIRASAKYNKENIKSLAFQLNITTDRDIINHLATKENKTGYIKELIREDMKKNP
jgi:hypothetical protein